MKNVSQSFKDNIKKYGRQLDSRIKIGNSIIGKQDINSINPSFHTSLFKTVMKSFEIDCNLFIPKDEIINISIGVKFGNSGYEYIEYENFKVKSCEKQEDTESFKIVAYDMMMESMIDYDLELKEEISLREYLIKIFERISWDTKGIPTTFINSKKLINPNIHVGIGYTFRDVLDEIATITGSFIYIKDNVPTLGYITETNETINEEYLSQDDVTIGEKYLINSLVFSRAEESDNIFRKDDKSIQENGLYEFRIEDNQIISTNDRDVYIDELFNYLKTLEFYIYDVKSTGIMWLDICDKFTFDIHGSTYSTIILNDEITVDQDIEEMLYAERPEETETDYKCADTTDKRINQAYILVNKQKQEITQRVSVVEGSINNLTNTKAEAEGKNIHINDSAEEPLVDISLHGETTQETSTQSSNLFDEEYYNNDDIYTSATYKYVKARFTGNRVLWFKATLKEGKTAQTGAYISLSESAGSPYTSGTKTAYAISNGSATSGSNTFVDVNTLYINIYPNTLSCATIFDNYNLWVSTDNVSYEKFIPDSPSPDYPSEIENVEGNVEVKVERKNRLKNVATTTIINGITFTVNEDKSVTLFGTATADTNYYFYTTSNFLALKKGTYALSGVKGGSTTSYRMLVYKTDWTLLGQDIGSGATFTLEEDTNVFIYIWVKNGTTVNTTVYPQIEEGTEPTDYEPYKSQTAYFPLAEGQKLMEGSYLADDGVHNKHKQEVVSISGIGTLSNGNIVGIFYATDKAYKGNNFALCSKAIFTAIGDALRFQEGTLYENEANVCLVGNSTDTLETLKEKYDGAILEYELAEEEIVPYTEEQQEAWNKIKALTTYKNITNITSDAYVKIVYMRNNGLDVYETKQNADKRYTETTEKFAETKITTDSIKDTVSTTQTTVANNYQELKGKFDDYAPKSDIITIQNSVEKIQTDTYTKTEINTKLTDGSVTKVLTTAGTFDENGLTIEKTNAKTKGNFNEKGITVADATSGSSQELLFAGYDEELNETIVRSKNMTVEKYFVECNIARREEYSNPILGGKGVGVFIL